MSEGTFVVREFTLQSGQEFENIKLVYKTYGALNARRDNAVLFPTWFNVNHRRIDWIIGPEKALDPSRHFIITVNLLCNGASSSPSNTPEPFAAASFPTISVLDNVLLQHLLVTELWGVTRFAAVIGRSMGAQVAFQWASYFPAMVPKMLALCGSAKTSPHNYIFLESIKQGIRLDPDFKDGCYATQPHRGLDLMRTIYDGWVVSQSFYRRELHISARFPTTQQYVERPFEGIRSDANDVLAQIASWQKADISNNDRFNGDIRAALSNISAESIVMPSRTDLYFPPEDSENEVALMPNAELRVIESVWGHRAGAPGGDPADIAFIERGIRDLLD